MTIDDGTSSDCTDGHPGQVERDRPAGRRGRRRTARRRRWCRRRTGRRRRRARCTAPAARRSPRCVPGSDDGVRGVGGVPRAAAQQVQVALAAGAPQPRLPVGADVLLAEQLDEPRCGPRRGAGRASARSRRRRPAGCGRGVQPSSRVRCRRGRLGQRPSRPARVRGVREPDGPQPWIVSSGCSGTATVCRCLRRSDHGDRASLSPARRRRDLVPTSPGRRSTSSWWAAG